MINDKYAESALTAKIIGCTMEVHRTLGNGFQEVIYQRCMVIEMTKQDYILVGNMKCSSFTKERR